MKRGSRSDRERTSSSRPTGSVAPAGAAEAVTGTPGQRRSGTCAPYIPLNGASNYMHVSHSVMRTTPFALPRLGSWTRPPTVLEGTRDPVDQHRPRAEQPEAEL